MISINKSSNSDDSSNKKDVIEKLQNLLDIIHDKEEYYPGSFHENVDLSEIIQAIYSILFDKKKQSVQIIVEKNKNNSLDLIIDTIN